MNQIIHPDFKLNGKSFTYIELLSEALYLKENGQLFEKEIGKLERMNPQAAEFSVQANYIDTLLDLPWSEYSDDNFDLKHCFWRLELPQ